MGNLYYSQLNLEIGQYTMASKIFLARTEEQNHFKQTLKQLKKSNNHQKSQEIDPYIYLFYGEGGMGKTT